MSDRTGREYGPGIKFLAERLGESPDLLASDPRTLARAVQVFSQEAAELIRGYGSEDPEVRAAAERRWAEVAERFERPADETRGAEFRGRLQRILSDTVERLEALVREVEPDDPQRTGENARADGGRTPRARGDTGRPR